MLSRNEVLNLWYRWTCDSKNMWTLMRQITELSFEIVMNKAPHLVENLPTQFLYGKNCSSVVWMKYSIYCRTPSASGGGWEERVAFMEFGHSAKRGVLLQLQLGWRVGAQQGQRWLCRGSEVSALGEGFQRLLTFHRRPPQVVPCVGATVTISWGDFLLVHDAGHRI